jgi:hypothetical protein
MAPRTHIKKRRESGLTDQYTEELNESLDEINEAAFLVKSIDAQMLRIVKQIESLNRNPTGSIHYRVTDLIEMYTELRTIDLPLAEIDLKEAHRRHHVFMNIGILHQF